MSDKIEQAITALENIIPGFNRPDDIVFSEIDDYCDLREWMLEAVLGEEHSAYVEWKEFDSWGFEGMCELVTIQKLGIKLSIDELYDEDEMLIDCETDPYNLYIPHLNQQLKNHSLQLVEFGAHANPSFICIPLNHDSVSQLNSALKAIDISLIVPGISNV